MQQSKETKEFKVGDRVCWMGVEADSGIITSLFTDSTCAWVLWDSDGEESWARIHELQHEQPKDTSEEHPITFYNIRDDIPIGGFAKVGNEVYKVVEVNGCSRCEFITNETYCEIAKCTRSSRADKIYVSFILYATIPEDNDEQP